MDVFAIYSGAEHAYWQGKNELDHGQLRPYLTTEKIQTTWFASDKVALTNLKRLEGMLTNDYRLRVVKINLEKMSKKSRTIPSEEEA